MAYGNYLVSIKESDLRLLNTDVTAIIEPSYEVMVSHMMAYSIEEQPLGQLLDHILDKGAIVNKSYYHPLRVPLYYTNKEIKDIYLKATKIWADTLKNHAIAHNDWYRVEIDLILSVVEYAFEHNEYLLSVLEPPFNHEDLSLVQIPFSKALQDKYFIDFSKFD